MRLLFIGAFGALGCVMRYLVAGWVQVSAGRYLPLGTLTVNLLGSFVIGLIMEGSLRSTVLGADLRIGLTVGFLGGFTTFSTFSYETVRLLEDGSYLAAGANILCSVAACLIAAAAGILLARQL
jgi:CrcB protein